jgi:integrase/recombinase XerD
LIRYYSQQLKAQGKAVNTIRTYQTDLATFARFLTKSEQDVTEMGLPLLQAYCAYLTEQGYVRSSVSRQLTALKGFLRHLREQGVLERA